MYIVIMNIGNLTKSYFSYFIDPYKAVMLYLIGKVNYVILKLVSYYFIP